MNITNRPNQMGENYANTTKFKLLMVLIVTVIAMAVGVIFMKYQLPTPITEDYHPLEGTKWALLVAGSKGIVDYRHQADVCHAYHILKANGFKDKNIIVMMYDDIALHPDNPFQGKLFNEQNHWKLGQDVYKGVPKDYIGNDVNLGNFKAVILGDKASVEGGSGKVIATELDDTVFIYYSNHGTQSYLHLPNGEHLTDDFLKHTLLQKRATSVFRSMVIFIEACYNGSMFLNFPGDLGIYAITAANESQVSWGTHCQGIFSDHFYATLSDEDDKKFCVGDAFSAAWMRFIEKPDASAIVGDLYTQVFELAFFV